MPEIQKKIFIHRFFHDRKLEEIAEIAATVPPPVATFLLTARQEADAIAEQQRFCGYLPDSDYPDLYCNGCLRQ